MTAFRTSDQVGAKQDLSDIVKEVTPQDTPFVNSLGSRKVNNVVFTWVDKNFAAASSKTMIAEGADVTVTNADGRALRTNYTEIFAKQVEVSDSAEATKQAGMATLAERIVDQVRTIQREKEYVYLNDFAADSTVTSRNTASAQRQIDSSLITSSVGSLAKADIDGILETAYTKGAMVDTVYIHPSLKKVMSTVLTYAPVVREAGQGKVVADAVDIYQSDFGDVNIVKCRHILSTDILFCDSSLWKEAVLIPMTTYTVARTGLAEKRLITTEVGLQNDNKFGNALLRDVTA